MSKSEKMPSKKRKREEPPIPPKQVEESDFNPNIEKTKVASTEPKTKRRSNKFAHSERDALIEAQVAGSMDGLDAVASQNTTSKRKRKRPEKSTEKNDVEDLELNGEVEGDSSNREQSAQQIRMVSVIETPKSNKSKKRKKINGSNGNEACTLGEGNGGEAHARIQDDLEREDEENHGDTNLKKKHRFIVFVGNLPFSTTTEALTSHFAKITPNATRHITDKQTGRSKGFAFLEFDAYDRMKTCLKLYHHSWFPAQEIEKKENGEGEKGKKKGKKGKKDGNGDEVKEAPRKINVELTTGGGGNSESRKERLHEKNSKLASQRKRTAETEFAKRAEENTGKKAKGNGSHRRGQSMRGMADKRGKRRWGTENENEEPKGRKPSAEDSQGIHPSRLARMSK